MRSTTVAELNDPTLHSLFCLNEGKNLIMFVFFFPVELELIDVSRRRVRRTDYPLTIATIRRRCRLMWRGVYSIRLKVITISLMRAVRPSETDSRQLSMYFYPIQKQKVAEMYWYSYNYRLSNMTHPSRTRNCLGWPLELCLISISSSRWLDQSFRPRRDWKNIFHMP